MKYRQPSQAAHALVDEFERVILFTYDDATGKRMAVGQKPKGVPTIGRGNVSHALPVRNITMDEAEAYYAEDVKSTLRTIYRYLTDEFIDDLPQACFDALFSFIFNVGDQAFRDPETGKPTNFIAALKRDLKEVPAQMRRWVYDNGKRLGGLERRRESEASLWMSGLDLSLPGIIEETPDARIVPTPPKPAISQGPMLDRPAVGATTTAVGTAGAVASETAQQLSFMQSSTGHVVQLICLLLVLLGAGLTIWALVRQSKEGRA